MTKLNSKVNGLTLIEALIWFAVFAAVVAGVFAIYGSARNANNVATVNRELVTIYTRAETIYAHESPADLNNQTAMNLGIFPKNIKVSSSGQVSNIFGGTITLQGFYPRTFMVIYTNVPAGETCVNIIKAQKAVGWIDAQVNETGITLVDHERITGGAWAYSLPYVAQACSSSEGSVTLIFARSS